MRGVAEAALRCGTAERVVGGKVERAARVMLGRCSDHGGTVLRSIRCDASFRLLLITATSSRSKRLGKFNLPAVEGWQINSFFILYSGGNRQHSLSVTYQASKQHTLNTQSRNGGIHSC